MRIISGTARGLKLQSLSGEQTRPTLDNVKEAVFSMLFEYVRGASVLDLFAGSGALGIEALSRGASYADFVDINPASVSVVKANLEKARFSERSSVYTMSAKDYLLRAAKENKEYDLIFLDPPYSEGLYDEALCLILRDKLIKGGGLIVCEFDNGTDIDIKDFHLIKDKRYGRVCVNILEAPQ